MMGVYWGAFDPPTEAHIAIITAALNDPAIEKVLVVVNNHAYKNYTFPLGVRLRMMKKVIDKYGLKNVELLWQDDTHRLDILALRKMTNAPICAIAGYDAYKKWVDFSTPEERSSFDAIAVVPRDNDSPVLFDKITFILPINTKYRDISSTKLRAQLTSPEIENNH